jgi:hypothetical protein
MNSRWLYSISILLTVIAVLATSPLQGYETGSTPLSVPVDEEGFDEEVEKDLDDLNEFGLIVGLSCSDDFLPTLHGLSVGDSLAVDVLHVPCFGTRGPPA